MSIPQDRLATALNQGLRHLDHAQEPQTTEGIVASCREIAAQHRLNDGQYAYLLMRQLLLARWRGVHAPLVYPEASTLAVLVLSSVEDDDAMSWLSDSVATLIAGATERWEEAERHLWRKR